jgi:hypothetical protein
MPLPATFDDAGANGLPLSDQRALTTLTHLTADQISDVVRFVQSRGESVNGIVAEYKVTSKAPVPTLGLMDVSTDDSPLTMRLIGRAVSALLLTIMSSEFDDEEWSEVFDTILGGLPLSTREYYQSHVDVPVKEVLNEDTLLDIGKGMLEWASGGGIAGHVIQMLTGTDIDSFIQEAVSKAGGAKLPQLYRFGAVLEDAARDISLAAEEALGHQFGTFGEIGGPRSGPNHDMHMIKAIREMGGPQRVAALANNGARALHSFGYTSDAVSRRALEAGGPDHALAKPNPALQPYSHGVQKAQELQSWMVNNPSTVRKYASLLAEGGGPRRRKKHRYGSSAVERGGAKRSATGDDLDNIVNGGVDLLADLLSQRNNSDMASRVRAVSALRSVERGGPNRDNPQSASEHVPERGHPLPGRPEVPEEELRAFFYTDK